MVGLHTSRIGRIDMYHQVRRSIRIETRIIIGWNVSSSKYLKYLGVTPNLRTVPIFTIDYRGRKSSILRNIL